MSDSEFVIDQETYKRCSEPHESDEAANITLRAFFDDIVVLREKHRVPEVVVAAAAYHGNGEAVAMTFARGHSSTWPELVAGLYRRHCVPLLEEARKIERLSRRVSDTDVDKLG